MDATDRKKIGSVFARPHRVGVNASPARTEVIEIPCLRGRRFSSLNRGGAASIARSSSPFLFFRGDLHSRCKLELTSNNDAFTRLHAVDNYLHVAVLFLSGLHLAQIKC